MFDPQTADDAFVMALPGPPSHAFWSEGDSAVYFLAGEVIYRAGWQVGARPEPVLTIPPSFTAGPNTVDDIWIDEQSGTWRASVIALEGASSRASIWEHGTSGAWTALRELETQCECGDCPCGSVLESFIQPRRRVSVDELLEGMRVQTHLERHEPGVQWLEGKHTIPSGSVSGAAIQFDVILGDSYHAMAPMLVVNRAGEAFREIVPKDQRCPSGQLAFEENDGFLLVVEEFSGSCGRVVDLRTGNVATSLPATTSGGVWARRPTDGTGR